jgi:hypothetical protein
MRERQRILSNLETLYRESFDKARAGGDQGHMDRLEFDFQRDQLYMEILLDLRDLLTLPTGEEQPESGGVTSLLDKAQKLRNLTRLR